MATRFNFQNADTPAITPDYDGSWDNTSSASRWVLDFTKGTDAIAAGSTISWGSGNAALDRQYISGRLKTGTVFDTSWTVKGQLMTREFANSDDVDRVRIGIKIVSEDGATVRATLLTTAAYGTLAEFINNATHRNCTFANGDNLTGSYTTVYGDRLVVEIGYRAQVSATTPQASAKWGENATDLPEDDTQTTDGAGWIEFSGTIESGAGEILITGVSATTAVGAVTATSPDGTANITGVSTTTALGTLIGKVTRFYFQNTTTADISPALDSHWVHVVELSRYVLSFSRINDAITAGTAIGAGEPGTGMVDRQYITGHLKTGTVFDTSWTVKGQLMVREISPVHDVKSVYICVKVVSSDGLTLRATLLNYDNYGTFLEFTTSATHRNGTFADGDNFTGSYTTVFGDRLVVEIGYVGEVSGSSPIALAKWGDGADDLPVNDTQTTDGAGWIEFSGPIEDGSGEAQATLTGVTAATAVGAVSAVGETASVASPQSATGSGSTTSRDAMVLIRTQQMTPLQIHGSVTPGGVGAETAVGSLGAMGETRIELVGQEAQLGMGGPVGHGIRNLSDEELLLLALAA